MRGFSKCQPATVSQTVGASAASFNTVWPVDAFQVDASAMVPQLTNGPSETRIDYPTAGMRRNALGFSDSGTETAYFFWPVQPSRWDFTMANVRMRLYGSSIVSATGDDIVFETATRLLQVSDDGDDVATFPWSSDVQTVITGRDALNEMGGFETTFTPPAPGGRSLSSSINTVDNFLQFRIQRNPGDASDTFADTWYLYIAGFQFSHDFNNVVQWT